MTALYVLASVAGQRIAVDATAVESVVDIAMVVPVPHAPPHVIGLTSIRSQVLTVIDCSAVVGADDAPPTGRALIVMLDGHRYALRVDRVDDVTALGHADIAGDPSLGAHWAPISSGVVRIGEGFAVVVEPAQFIAPHPIAMVA